MKIINTLAAATILFSFTACNNSHGTASLITTADTTIMSDSNKVVKTEQEWKELLTDEEYRVLREKGTERAYTGEYDNHFEAGKYVCAACGTVLFVSDDKYNSGCGWPAYTQPANDTAVEEHLDKSHGMIRTEITCSNCGGHLGHVFNDGPKDKGGMRYCINSVSLKFEEASDSTETESDTAQTEE